MVFFWIARNIEYDMEGFLSGNLPSCDPDYTFRDGKTVCSGYAALFYEMTHDKLLVKILSGFAKGYGYEPGMKSRRPGTCLEWNFPKQQMALTRQHMGC